MEGFQIDSDFDGFSDFDLEIEDVFETRYIKPPRSKERATHLLKYDNAKKLAQDLKPTKGMCAHVIVNGSFIFGDFIECFLVENGIIAKKMTISTLSMGYESVDSLLELMETGYIENLDLIVSGFHFSHKRHTIVQYTYDHLDIEDRFQLAVADSHTKVCLIETENGSKVVIKGSANLISSGCIEEFSIEENTELYDFYYLYHQNIVEVYKTIDKTVRGKKLWEAIKK